MAAVVGGGGDSPFGRRQYRPGCRVGSHLGGYPWVFRTRGGNGDAGARDRHGPLHRRPGDSAPAALGRAAAARATAADGGLGAAPRRRPAGPWRPARRPAVRPDGAHQRRGRGIDLSLRPGLYARVPHRASSGSP